MLPQKGDGFVGPLSAGNLTVCVGAGSISRIADLLRLLAATSRAAGSNLFEACVRPRKNEGAFAMRITESKVRRTHAPTAAEKERQALEDAWWASQGLTNRRRAFPSWDYVPSGRFTLELFDRISPGPGGLRRAGVWRDNGRSRLEDMLDAIVSRSRRTGQRRSSDA
jgi:hypothetical protein